MIIVDPAVWPAHGRRFAHLVSDESHEELHAFADRLGLPRRAFHRDHYDIPDELCDTAMALGAQPVTARELVKRLQLAGLRRKRVQLPREV